MNHSTWRTTTSTLHVTTNSAATFLNFITKSIQVWAGPDERIRLEVFYSRPGWRYLPAVYFGSSKIGARSPQTREMHSLSDPGKGRS